MSNGGRTPRQWLNWAVNLSQDNIMLMFGSVEKWLEFIKQLLSIDGCQPDPIDAVDQLTGFITTPIFKTLLGERFGWRRPKIKVTGAVTGHVRSSKGSTDGMVTMDFEIDSLKFVDVDDAGNTIREMDGVSRHVTDTDGEPVTEPDPDGGPGAVRPKRTVIRVEISKKLKKQKGKDKLPKTCKQAYARGVMLWDQDGWPEIHPEGPDDVGELDSLGMPVKPPPPREPPRRSPHGGQVLVPVPPEEKPE